MTIEVPAELLASHRRVYGDRGRVWIAALPGLAERWLEERDLVLAGPGLHGRVAMVLPVRRTDGSPAALKLQPVDPEHLGEASALRAWEGQGAVRLLAETENQGSSILLLEWLRADRCLVGEPEVDLAVEVIAEILVRLHSHVAPMELRTLASVLEDMLTSAPEMAALLPADQGRLVASWAQRVGELTCTGSDRLLHWDLHFENVLAADREPWLAIDPKPLAGDPGFDLLPALQNRWPEAVATGDPERAVRRRFDIMVEVLGLDRERAVGFCLARVLQNSLWSIADGRLALDDVQLTIAGALTHR